MALNGWMRLWVVISVLLGVFACLFTFSTRPSVWAVNDSWCSDGVSTLIPALEKAEGRSIDHAILENSLRDKGAEVCTERLRKIEAKRVNPALSDAIAPINSEYLQQETQLIRRHWGIGAAIWLAVCILLWLVGWSFSWVRRGFAKKAP